MRIYNIQSHVSKMIITFLVLFFIIIPIHFSYAEGNRHHASSPKRQQYIPHNPRKIERYRNHTRQNKERPKIKIQHKNHFDTETVKKIGLAMPDVLIPPSQQNNGIFINNKSRKPIIIVNKPTEKVLRFKNNGNVGGYFKLKVKGSKSNIDKYEKGLKVYDIEATKLTPTEYRDFLSKRKEAVSRDQRIRQERLEKINKILARDKKIRWERYEKRKEQINKYEKIRVDRTLRNQHIFDKNKKINQIKKDRQKMIEKLNIEWSKDKEKYKPKPSSKQKIPLYKYNKEKDVIIEISLNNSALKNDFFLISFDPDIEKGEKHFYRPLHMGKNYSAQVDVTRGNIHLQLAERDNIDVQGQYNNVLDEESVTIGTSAISHNSQNKIAVDFVISSLDDVSTYSGSIAGWSEELP